MSLFPPPATPASGERSYPGQVFEAAELSYAEQMTSYTQQRAAKRQERRQRRSPAEPVERVQLRIEAEALCHHRRCLRLDRRQADEIWRKYRQERQRYLQA